MPLRMSKDESVLKILDEIASLRLRRVVKASGRSGRRSEVITAGKRGRYVRYRLPQGEKGKNIDIALAPTIRAAVLRSAGNSIRIQAQDYREKVRRRRMSTLICIVFDTSSSMVMAEKITAAKALVDSLLLDAYQKRDRISLVTYCGQKAQQVLPFTSSIELAKPYLENMPFGGTTPLASGIQTGLNVLKLKIRAEPETTPIMLLVTDGTANTPITPGADIHRELLMACGAVNKSGVKTLVVDVSPDGSALAKEIADICGGRYFHTALYAEAAEFNVSIEDEMIQWPVMLSVIDPSIGGILIQGASASQVTSAMERLSGVLPDIPVIKGCQFKCHPSDTSQMCPSCYEKYSKGEIEVEELPMEVVTLPEDVRINDLVGRIDRSMGATMDAFLPGIFAKANRGLLFIPKIETLPDDVIDVILDVFILGINKVEYGGLTIRHPCMFSMIGSMGEEGSEIHPRLFDHISLLNDLTKTSSIERRIRSLKQRKEFDTDPETFLDDLEHERADMRMLLSKSQELLPSVVIPENLLDVVTRVCMDFNVAGHLPDILIEKTTRAIAAFNERTTINEDDLLEATEMVLPLTVEKSVSQTDFIEKFSEEVKGIG